MRHRYLLALAVMACLALSASPTLAARLISVTPLDTGCVSGPTGSSVQKWDVEPGQSYEITISDVTECGNGGTDPTINVRVNATGSGNFDLVARFVAPGVYKFSFTLPIDATCTLPIFYCTTPGVGSSGLFVRRSDGGTHQAHLRAASFGPGCTNPTPILGPDCIVVKSQPRSWGQVKSIYR